MPHVSTNTPQKQSLWRQILHIAGSYLLPLGIWVCYFLDTYICFFAFPFTHPLVTEPSSRLRPMPNTLNNKQKLKPNILSYKM